MCFLASKGCDFSIDHSTHPTTATTTTSTAAAVSSATVAQRTFDAPPRIKEDPIHIGNNAMLRIRSLSTAELFPYPFPVSPHVCQSDGSRVDGELMCFGKSTFYVIPYWFSYKLKLKVLKTSKRCFSYWRTVFFVCVSDYLEPFWMKQF